MAKRVLLLILWFLVSLFLCLVKEAYHHLKDQRGKEEIADSQLHSFTCTSCSEHKYTTPFPGQMYCRAGLTPCSRTTHRQSRKNPSLLHVMVICAFTNSRPYYYSFFCIKMEPWEWQNSNWDETQEPSIQQKGLWQALHGGLLSPHWSFDAQLSTGTGTMSANRTAFIPQKLQIFPNQEGLAHSQMFFMCRETCTHTWVSVH